MTRVTFTLSIAAFALSATAFAPAAYAQAPQHAPPSTPPTTGAAPTNGAQPSEQNMEEARQRYQRGLQLFNEANYEAARVEFERAYQLAPSYKILYNIGLAYEQLGDYVGAQSTLQKYLELGGSEISPERRTEVAKELAQIRPRIARVKVNTNVEGSEMMIDDTCGTEAGNAAVNCGVVPGNSREYLVNPGRRRVTVRRDGYLTETQTVTVAGSDKTEITVNLKPLPKEYKEKEKNPFVLPMIIGWSVTAAGVATTIVTGVLANNAKDDQEAAVNKFGATRDELDSAKDKTKTLATVTDVALIGTGVAAAVSTYFTIRAIGWKGEGGSEANVRVGVGTVTLGGRF